MSEPTEPLDLAAIEARINKIHPRPWMYDTSDPAQIYKDSATLLAEVKRLHGENERLRGKGLVEFSWWLIEGYCGGFDYTVVAENLEEARKFGKEHLREYEYKQILENEPDDISEVEPKLSGYYEYHMDPGG